MKEVIIIILAFIALLMPSTANYIDKSDFNQKYECRRSYKEVFGEDYEEIDSDFEK